MEKASWNTKKALEITLQRFKSKLRVKNDEARVLLALLQLYDERVKKHSSLCTIMLLNPVYLLSHKAYYMENIYFLSDKVNCRIETNNRERSLSLLIAKKIISILAVPF
jgi:hypothetical protein